MPRKATRKKTNHKGDNMKPACKKCSWWVKESICDFVYTTPGGEAYKKGHGAGIEVTVLDDSGLWVQLKTGPDFGCVNFHPDGQRT